MSKTKVLHLNTLERKMLLRALDEHLYTLLSQCATATPEGMAKRFARDALFHLREKVK